MKHFYLLLAFFFAVLAKGQELGTPFIVNYDNDAYNGHTQNWGIAQGTDGRLYVANSIGVLIFNGHSWRVLALEGVARSVCADPSGTIFVGAQGDLGYLKPDQLGLERFESLLQHIPEANRNFSDVWQTVYVEGRGVFFQTNKATFLWDGKRMKVWTAPNAFHTLVAIGKDVYVRQQTVGLMQALADTVALAPGGEYFAKEPVFALLPYSGDTCLVATYREGLLRWNRKTGAIAPFETPISQRLKETGLYHAIALKSGDYALGMLRGGIACVNKQGMPTLLVDERVGLRNNRVKFLMEDEAGNIWAALNDGLSMLAASSSIRHWHKPHGVSDKVYSLARHKGKLYAGLASGGFVMENDSFANIEGLVGQTWGWLTFQNSALLVASQGGLYEVQEGKKEAKAIYVSTHFNANHIYAIHESLRQPQILLMGLNNGAAIGQFDGKKWLPPVRMDSIDDEIASIAENEHGIWLGGYYGSVYRLQGEYPNYALSVYDSTKGLPPVLGNILMQKHEGQLLANSIGGAFYYDKATDTFLRYAPLVNDFSQNNGVRLLEDDGKGGVWFVSEHKENERGTLYYANKSQGIWHTNTHAIPEMPAMEFRALLAEGNRLWVAGSKGVFSYNTAEINRQKPPFHAFIAEVYAKDTILLGTGKSLAGKLVLAHAQAPLVFQLTASNYFGATEFRYRLEGEDGDWSNWDTSTKLRYSSLWEGNYALRVQARDIYGNVTEECVLPFVVRPPMYRTVWAYIGYLLLAASLVFALVKANTHRLKAQNAHLERVVAERTAEINTQKEEITAQAELLQSVNNMVVSKNSELEQRQEEVLAQAEQLRKANEIILKKNHAITASINYARRIQLAALPPKESIAGAFQEFDLLFKPKDIVSGDFYWFHRAGSQAVLAAMDCTGHGVPGAFMSLMGNDALTQAVVAEQILSPSEILHRVDEILRQTLRQEETENRDSIDMSVCHFDFGRRELRYAGAKGMGLFAPQNGEALQLKGSKFSAGGESHLQKSFDSISIAWKPGDCLFLYSDGFQDQIGGPDDRKLMGHRLRGILLHHAGKASIYDTIAQAEQFLQDWMHQKQQIDDVMLLGMRLG